MILEQNFERTKVESYEYRESGICIFIDMDAEEKLRAHLISIVQELPMDKLTEFSALLEKIGGHQTSKERTLSMSGAWSELDEDLFSDLTDHLHDRRSHDRSFN